MKKRRYFAVLITLVLLCSIVGATAQQLTVQDVLNQIKAEHPQWQGMYEEGFFDCSEMSAYVVYRLAVAGIESHIELGVMSWGGSYIYHAWVVIDATEQVVESVYLITPVRDYNTLYLQFEGYTPDVYPDSEWDWWNSISNQARYLHGLTINGNLGQQKWAQRQLEIDFREDFE